MHRTPPPRDERGSTTAEYAVGTLGAVCVAGVLIRLGGDDGWLGQVLVDIVRRALDPTVLLDLVHDGPFRGIRP